jgi:hypothetical protein
MDRASTKSRLEQVAALAVEPLRPGAFTAVQAWPSVELQGIRHLSRHHAAGNVGFLSYHSGEGAGIRTLNLGLKRPLLCR